MSIVFIDESENILTIYKSFLSKLNKRSFIIGLALLLIAIVAEIGLTIYLPNSRKPIYDALSEHSQSGFYLGLQLLFVVHVFLLMSQSLKTWLGQRLSFIARDALMHTTLDTWIEKGSAEELTVPGSRLVDDVRVATETSIVVGSEVLISSCISVGLVLSMWGNTKLLIAAMLYSLISVGLAAAFRKPLVSRRYAHLDMEGENRNLLTQKALGQELQTSHLKTAWMSLRTAYRRYIRMSQYYRLFSAVQNSLTIIVPFLILAGEYFSGSLSLGDVMQQTLAFDLLVLNASILVTLYPQITDAQTAILRVKELYDHVHRKDAK